MDFFEVVERMSGAPSVPYDNASLSVDEWALAKVLLRKVAPSAGQVGWLELTGGDESFD